MPDFPSRDDIADAMQAVGDYLEQGGGGVIDQAVTPTRIASETDNVIEEMGYTALQFPAIPYGVGGAIVNGAGRAINSVAEHVVRPNEE